MQVVARVFLGNAIADCLTLYNGGLKVALHALQVVAPCYRGMQLQIARRLTRAEGRA